MVLDGDALKRGTRYLAHTVPKIIGNAHFQSDSNRIQVPIHVLVAPRSEVPVALTLHLTSHRSVSLRKADVMMACLHEMGRTLKFNYLRNSSKDVRMASSQPKRYGWLIQSLYEGVMSC